MNILRVVLLLAFLAGCGSPPAADTPIPPAPPTAPAAVESIPAVLTIPALELNAPIDRTGLNPDHTITAPDVNHPERAAWVDIGPQPGSIGRAVIAGHINGGGHPGVFADLATIPIGAEITVTDQDGVDRRFVVEQVTQWPKTGFPTGRVYGDTQQAELALVTCGGELDPAAHSYKDNIIVMARLV